MFETTIESAQNFTGGKEKMRGTLRDFKNYVLSLANCHGDANLFVRRSVTHEQFWRNLEVYRAGWLRDRPELYGGDVDIYIPLDPTTWRDFERRLDRVVAPPAVPPHRPLSPFFSAQ